MLYRPGKLLTKATKLACLISFLSCSGIAFAVDSTTILPASGVNAGKAPRDTQFQIEMTEGWTKLVTYYADYSAQPTSADSLPRRPKTCENNEQIVNYNYDNAARVTTVCTSYGCDTSCNWYDVACWGEVAACQTCIAGCTITQQSCSCPKMRCERNEFAWTEDFSGPEILASVTCGIKGKIPKTEMVQQEQKVAAAKTAGKQFAVGQIKGIFSRLSAEARNATNSNIANAAGTVASGMAAAAAEAERIARAAAQAILDAANAVGDWFSSW